MLRDQGHGDQTIGLRDHQVPRNERPHRKAHDVRMGDFEVVQQPHDVAAHFRAVRRRLPWFAALPVAAGIHRNDAVVARQISEHACVDPVTVGCSRVAMNENNRGSLSLLDEANRDAVRLEEPFLWIRRLQRSHRK
jgi:hypothetical protein